MEGVEVEKESSLEKSSSILKLKKEVSAGSVEKELGKAGSEDWGGVRRALKESGDEEEEEGEGAKRSRLIKSFMGSNASEDMAVAWQDGCD
jgi:hypothetical protein